MKFRITIGEKSTVEKPFIIQYKSFFFWKTFKHFQKGIEQNITIPYFSKEGAEKQLKLLKETVENSLK